MPRAKRYHIRGYVWHITHRCHKREFLLKFAMDRQRWMHWLFEAKKRYSLFDHKILYSVAGSGSRQDFRKSHARWVAEALRLNRHQREKRWSESIAVGSKTFIENFKKELGHKARARKILKSGSVVELRERSAAYNAGFSIENDVLSEKNSYLWKENNINP